MLLSCVNDVWLTLILTATLLLTFAGLGKLLCIGRHLSSSHLSMLQVHLLDLLISFFDQLFLVRPELFLLLLLEFLHLQIQDLLFDTLLNYLLYVLVLAHF